MGGRSWTGLVLSCRAGGVIDPYTDEAAYEAVERRLEARRSGALAREWAYEADRQKWIDTHYPAAAAAYRRRICKGHQFT